MDEGTVESGVAVTGRQESGVRSQKSGVRSQKSREEPCTIQYKCCVVHLESVASLDVVAVYTAAPNGGQVSTMDVEHINERKL